jgi:hypothetical protein
MNKYLYARMAISLLLTTIFSVAFADSKLIPPPARVGGTVTITGTISVGSTQIIQGADAGFTFTITKLDGTPYTPIANDGDGLNTSNWYLIDIPIFDATDQPGGATTGETAILHVFRNGVELKLTSPANGQITVGAMGSNTQINVITQAPAPTKPQDIPTLSEWSMIILSTILLLYALVSLRRSKA